MNGQMKGRYRMENQRKAGAILSYVTLLLNSLISILYTPVMLKVLGQSEYGVYSLASSVVSSLGVLNFGLGNAVIRFTAKYRALKNEEKCSNLYGMFCIVYGLLSFLALIAGIIITLNSDEMFSNSLKVGELNKLRILLGVMVFNVSIGIGLGVFSCIILAYEKFIFQQVTVLIGAIANPLLVLPLLLMGYGSVAMVSVTTILNLITYVVNIYYCFKVLKIKIVFCRFESRVLKEVIVFSFFIFLNLIIDRIYWSTDQIIIGKFIGTVAVSVYSIGTVFSGYFSGFASAISNVFLSRVTGMVTEGATEREISDLFIKIGRVQFVVIAFFLSGFIVLGREFIQIWAGKNYSSSYTIALIILIPLSITLIQSMGGVILQAKNMQRFKSVVYFFIAIVNVFLSILFVQRWGVVGCALATAIAFCVGNIITMNIYYWKKIKIDIPRFWLNIFRMCLPLVVSLLFGILLNQMLNADNGLLFILKGMLFCVVYIVLMWLIGMNRYEKDLFIVPVKATAYRFTRKVYSTISTRFY